MTRVLTIAGLLCLLLLSSGAQAQQTPPKIALLIGNRSYDDSVGALKNPHNDIAVVSEALLRQGFRVLPLVKDARRSAILGAVRDLARQLNAAGAGAIGFLYYSGHGAAESDTGFNYLIPIDAKEPGSATFWDESLKLDEVLKLLDTARGAAKFVVFDACRNELRVPAKGASKGLMPVAEQQGMLIAYATAPGHTASDSGAASGPYAAALARELANGGQDHLNLFQNVREQVLAATSGVQQPWEINGLARRVYLSGGPKGEREQQSPAGMPTGAAEVVRTCREVEGMTSLPMLAVLERQHKGTPVADCIFARMAELKAVPVEASGKAQDAAGTREAPRETGSQTSAAAVGAAISTSSFKGNSGHDKAGSKVTTGAEALVADNFASIKGMRVGIITNQTGRVEDKQLVDLIWKSTSVKLAAIFVPEHGYMGRIEAGEYVKDRTDGATAVPIYSLYGNTRKPTARMMDGIDVLIFDLQDVGARFYTFISTMGLAMQAAAAAKIPFLVLDRPNPLGGDYVSGFVLEDEQRTFVGQYAIPIAHGMTVAELASMIKKRKMLPGLEQLDLRIQPLVGWSRWMRWRDFSDIWFATSPNLDNHDAALLYAGLGLLEGVNVNEGRGTDRPFRMFGADWVDGDALAREINGYGLRGVEFESVRFTPTGNRFKATNPRFDGLTINGVRAKVLDHRAVEPVEAGVVALALLHAQAKKNGVKAFFLADNWLDKLAGTARLRRMIVEGHSAAAIVASWQAEVASFRRAREPYLLYK